MSPAIPVPQSTGVLARAVTMARRHLEMDGVCIVELTAAGEVCRAVAGDPPRLDSAPSGASQRARPPLSALLARAEIRPLVADACSGGADAAGLRARACETGAFIGVPLRFSDGTLFGAIYGASRRPVGHLGERDVRFLAMLGEAIVGDLDRHRESEQLRAHVAAIIEREDLRMAFQPIVDLHGDECLGVEALARFRKPFGRPDETIAIAERFGLGLELERLAVSKAWGLIELLGADQYLAVNVAPTVLVELARRANLAASLQLERVVVEVTEHSAVASYTPLRRQLGPLRKRGLRIAVDDAGAGYASLRHVLELRPDFIKVDRSLIHGIASDDARRVAVSALLAMALDLGSTVVAEGVERVTDLAAVRELGLHAAQGYLIARPTADVNALEGWIGPRSSRVAVRPPRPARTRARRAAT